MTKTKFTPLQQSVLDELRDMGGCSVPALAESLGEQQGSVRATLRRLRRDNLVVYDDYQLRPGHWFLTSDGEAIVGQAADD